MDIHTILFLTMSVVLTKLAHDDWKNQTVDQRYGYYMYGVATIAFLINNLIAFWFFAMFAVIFILPQIKKKTEFLMKAGDWTTLSWIIPILLILNPIYFAAWLILLGGVLLIARIYWKTNKTPGTPFMLIATLIVWYLTYLKVFG